MALRDIAEAYGGMAAIAQEADFLISLPHVCKDRLGKELRLTARLQLRLGDQPFDVLVVDPEVTLNPVHAHAIETARVL